MKIPALRRFLLTVLACIGLASSASAAWGTIHLTVMVPQNCDPYWGPELLPMAGVHCSMSGPGIIVNGMASSPITDADGHAYFVFWYNSTSDVITLRGWYVFTPPDGGPQRKESKTDMVTVDYAINNNPVFFIFDVPKECQCYPWAPCGW